ncbi:hypothetical protein [Actinomadura sp. KC216]|nr:hypothetical protein [Actinomadura sp. KC216]
MTRLSVLIARARDMVQDPQARIRVLFALVYFALAAAALLSGGIW